MERKLSGLFVHFVHIAYALFFDLFPTTKTIYAHLLTGEIIPPRKHQIKWEEDLKFRNCSIIWTTIYTNDFWCIVETKLRSFQTKLNCRAIVTNRQLHDFEIKSTDKCDFCGETTETLVHLFCSCKCVCIELLVRD